MLNTPPTYAIYIAGLVFEWLLAQGRPGRDRAQEHRQGEAALRLPRCRPVSTSHRVRKEDRSRMNVVFRLSGRSAGQGVPAGCRSAGHGATEGPSRGRRHSRVDLQRDADRRRAGARRLTCANSRSSTDDRHDEVSTSLRSTRSRARACTGFRARAMRSARRSSTRTRSSCARTTCSRWRYRAASRRSAAPAPAPTTFRWPRCRVAACRCSTRRVRTPTR